MLHKNKIIINNIMVEYTCKKCNRIFTRKSTYEDHLNKKNPCKIKKIGHGNDMKYELLMKKIEEIINSNTQLLKDEFKKENDELKRNLEKENNELKEEFKKEKEELKIELQKENKGLKDEIKKLKQIMNKTIVNGTNIGRDDNSKNIYVTINQFGKESNKHLDDVAVKKILNKGFLSIPEYIKNLHFDKKVPENHNVYLPNWRDKSKILVYNGEEWNLEDKDDIIDDLKIKGIDFIEKKYNELDKNNKHDALLIKKMDRFLESYNDDEEEKIDTLNKNIMLLLYNNRKIPEKTRKIQQ